MRIGILSVQNVNKNEQSKVFSVNDSGDLNYPGTSYVNKNHPNKMKILGEKPQHDRYKIIGVI